MNSIGQYKKLRVDHWLMNEGGACKHIVCVLGFLGKIFPHVLHFVPLGIGRHVM